METIVVREFARLTTSPCTGTLDRQQISASAFDWLCTLQRRLSNAGSSQLVDVEGRTWLRLNSLVGVLRTPCGTTLEILPKTHTDRDGVEESRKLLQKLVAALLGVSAKEADTASLARFNVPLTEWIMAQFLAHLSTLVKQGLRADYLRHEEELPYLRGQLNVTAQMRQRPERAHYFHLRHDVYLLDRAENRLLRCALDRVRRQTGQPDSWRLANELTERLSAIPASKRISEDWRAWSDTRLMAHYRTVRPWCQLVLGEGMPLATAGDADSPSLLFPMEKLFESYVARCIRSALPPDIVLQTQVASKHLCDHRDKGMF